MVLGLWADVRSSVKQSFLEVLRIKLFGVLVTVVHIFY